MAGRKNRISNEASPSPGEGVEARSEGAPSRVLPGGRGELRGRLPILGQVGRPVERADAARNRAAILEAARRLLKRQPIEEICMDELAEAAGVGKGTIYRRFADRSSLCRALLDEDSEKLQNAVLGGFGLAPTAGFRERLEHFFPLLFEFVFDHASLLSEAAAYARGEQGRFDHPSHVWLRDTLTLYITRAIQRGELPPVSPATTADFLLAALDPDLLRYHLARGATAASLAADFGVFWRRALGVPSS